MEKDKENGLAETLDTILTVAESEVVKYSHKKDEIQAKMKFMSEHGFEKELEHLRTKRDAFNDVFYDYRQLTEKLRELLNAWNS